MSERATCMTFPGACKVARELLDDNKRVHAVVIAAVDQGFVPPPTDTKALRTGLVLCEELVKGRWYCLTRGKEFPGGGE